MMTEGYRKIDGKRYEYGGTFDDHAAARVAVAKYKEILKIRQEAGFYRKGRARRYARIIPTMENGKRKHVVWVRQIGMGR